MSWISDLRELFSRTEQEKAISEAVLTAEAAVKITSKMKDFGEEYTKITDTTVKGCTNNLLDKIGIKMPSNTTTTTSTSTTP